MANLLIDKYIGKNKENPLVSKYLTSERKPLEKSSLLESAEISFEDQIDSLKSFPRAFMAVLKMNSRKIPDKEDFQALGKVVNYGFKTAQRVPSALQAGVFPIEGKSRAESAVQAFLRPEGLPDGYVGGEIAKKMNPKLWPLAGVLGTVGELLSYQVGTGNLTKQIAKGYQSAKLRGAMKELEGIVEKTAQPTVKALEVQDFFPKDWNEADKLGATKIWIRNQLTKNPKVGDVLLGKQTPFKVLTKSLASEAGQAELPSATPKETIKTLLSAAGGLPTKIVSDQSMSGGMKPPPPQNPTTEGAIPGDSENYVKEQVAKREEARKGESPTILKSISNLYKDAKAKLVDFASPIEDVLRETEKKEKLTIVPSFNITNQIDRVLRSPTIAGQFAKDNGLIKVIREVDNLDNLDQYLIAKQARDVEARGIKTGRDLKKDEKLITDFAEKYEPYAKIVTDYSRKLLDYSVDSGLISKDLSDTLKQRYPNYVPINRIFNELERVERPGTRAIASLSKQTIVQKLEGSEREIENPLASLIEKTNDAFKQGEKNKAGRLLAGYKNLPGNPFKLRELETGESSLHTISYLDNGVKRRFETTPEVAAAAKALNVQQLNTLGRIFAFPVRVAKLGITGINLPFIAANIAKDQVTAIINSRMSLKNSIANPALFTKALFEAVGHGKIYEEMARQGTLGTSFDIARNQERLSLEQIRSGKSLPSKIKYTVKHPGQLLRAVENIIGRSEELTRIQQYIVAKESLMKQGVGEGQAMVEAARASRENTVNFSRRGEWGQVLNSTFLYLNANIQGTRTFLRSFRERPYQTSTKIALLVFAPIAAATAWNLSDKKRKQAYEDISEFEKQQNLIIIPPNPIKDEDGTWNVIKIPLSQEINNIAGMARRPIEQAYGLNPVSVGDISRALGGAVVPISSASQLVPQAIKPSIEAATNKNLFTGKPIVPYGLQKLSPELQAKPYTSGTARLMGKKLKLSPMQIEQFIRGTVGGVGSQYLNISDRVLAGLKIIPKDQIGGQNVIQAILARFSKARGGHLDDESNKKIQEIIQSQADENFRLKQEAEILYTDLKKLPPQQANEKAKSIREKDPFLYSKLKDIVTKEKLGLDYNDRLIMQLQVGNGQRAKFIWNSLKAFKTNKEKNDYVKELRRKKVISDRVMEQLKFLKERKY